jgi:DNA-binding winged helix-turn-helix (wHTH) protein/TolB-like protein/Flp pilus assembly protein TadD
MDSSAPRAYRFGEFRVDLLRHELTGSGGANLNLSARAYDVLIFLLENRNRVVTKNQLMKAVWPQTVVEENNLNQAITILRRALGDRRDSPQYLRTIAGRGYRFVGDVTEEAAGGAIAGQPMAHPSLPSSVSATASASADERPPVAPMPPLAPPSPPQLATEPVAVPDPRRRNLLLGLGGAAVAAVGVAWWLRSRGTADATGPLRSLAVLPFRPLVEGASDPALEIGMADALITRLSTLPGLIVRPLSSVRAYAAAEQDPLHAGRELDVEAVLEGHVLIRSNRVRVTARLLEIADGSALWSGSFEEPLDQFFAAQDALAGQVVSALQIEMTDRDRLQLLAHPTDNVAAWQLYLNGRHYWERKTPEAMYRSIEYFEAAEKLDPAFALAAVGQADSWAVLGVYHVLPTAEAFGRAGEAAERALAIAPELPEALAAMGHVLVQGRRDWQGGERLYRRALKAKPRFAQCHMWVANNAAFQGRLNEAIAGARHAQELEPLSLTFAANVGLILYVMRDYASAMAQLTPLVEAAPEFSLARNHLARVLLTTGSPEKAIEVLGGKSSPAPGGLATLGRAYAATGQRDLAAAEIRQLEERGARGIGVGYDLALIYMALGDQDRALDAIERGVQDGSQGITFLNLEPAFDPIRNHPRFRAVSRAVGLG